MIYTPNTPPVTVAGQKRILFGKNRDRTHFQDHVSAPFLACINKVKPIHHTGKIKKDAYA